MDALGKLGLTQLISLGENQTKGHLRLPQPLYEFEVDLLWLMSTIYKHKKVSQTGAFQNIIFYDLLKGLTRLLAHFGVSVARQVDQVPKVVDLEMIDQLSLSRPTRSLGQTLSLGKHIDQAALADVAATDKCVFWGFGRWTVCNAGTTSDEFCLLNIHAAKVAMQIEGSFATFTDMKRWLQLILNFSLATLTLTACQFSANKSDRPLQPETEKRHYLALGDSYTIGTAIDSVNSYATQLTDTLRPLLNNSLSLTVVARNGWTTTDLLKALRSNTPDSTQDLVTLLIGVNNQYQGLSTAAYQEDFTELAQWSIALAKGRKERVIVLSIPDWSVTPAGAGKRTVVGKEIDAFNAINRAISDSLGISYLNITALSRQALGDSTLVAKDQLHFSAQMHQDWLAVLYPSAAAKLEEAP